MQQPGGTLALTVGREVRALRAGGTRVVVFQPGPSEQEVRGNDFMARDRVGKIIQRPFLAVGEHIIFVPIVAASSVDGSLEVLPDGFAFLNDANGGSSVFGYSSLDGVAFRVP